jgi:hypothetical protein
MKRKTMLTMLVLIAALVMPVVAPLIAQEVPLALPEGAADWSLVHAASASAEPDYRYKTRTLKITDEINQAPELVATLTVPNYIGSVEAVLETAEGTAHATVHVVYLPNDKWDDECYYSAMSVRYRRYGSWVLTGATSIVGWKDLYNYGFLPVDGGMSVFTPEGAELHILAGPGLYTSIVTLPYSTVDTGYATFAEALEGGSADVQYTGMGLPFLLALNDDTIAHFLEKDRLEPSASHEWPGLRELILEARYEVEPEVERTGLHNFESKRPYTKGMFLDIPYNVTAWYDPYVEKVVRIGLMKGDNNGRFLPGGDVKLSEVIAMAARLHNIYHGESGDFFQGPVWYNVYVRYAIANGIIREGDFDDYTRSATRGEMACILASAVPADALARINADVHVADVHSGISYSYQIYQLYEAGVLTGYVDGSYRPAETITRSETAAIIARIADAGLRIAF